MLASWNSDHLVSYCGLVQMHSTLSIYVRSFTKKLNLLKWSARTNNHSELYFINRRFIKWINLDFEAARTVDGSSSLCCVSTYKLIWATFVMQSSWLINQSVFIGYWSFSCLHPWDLMFTNSLLVWSHFFTSGHLNIWEYFPLVPSPFINPLICSNSLSTKNVRWSEWWKVLQQKNVNHKHGVVYFSWSTLVLEICSLQFIIPHWSWSLFSAEIVISDNQQNICYVV
jgi:hypothetical protein